MEEIREEKETRDAWENEEGEENGGLTVEVKRSSHAWMK